MYDITKKPTTKKVPRKEAAVRGIIAAIPSIVLLTIFYPTILSSIGGAILIPIITFWIFDALVSKIRTDLGEKGKIRPATWKTIIFWISVNIFLFMITPMVLLVLVFD